MRRPRIIPVLLLNEGGLVKTRKFKDPSYVGDPINAVRILNEKEVDELVLLDISASKYGTPPDFDLIQSIAVECFMPLAYGGGITKISEIYRLFSIGVEKIIINSAVMYEQELIKEAAEIFGSQSIVASMDCKRKLTGGYQIFSHSGRKISEGTPIKMAKLLEQAGAGELILTSVDRDGERDGFDTRLCQEISRALRIPVIACGGGGELRHFRDVLKNTECSAAAGGSFFVHHGKHRAVLITYPKSIDIENLLSE
ncbi:AglZ/HisF2 family acetamidino modification protein [Castellaniella sp. S9]|uniref:AglZ/HisF2 family acetamidino modification protein n=1 Tax=Castellaniella sp. S9 TaxID=2993652 RepID=UPI0022B54C95|nr:AglZ/HisF2 family acetamidino modification protein [Castellaniella sp. S9]